MPHLRQRNNELKTPIVKQGAGWSKSVTHGLTASEKFWRDSQRYEALRFTLYKIAAIIGLREVGIICEQTLNSVQIHGTTLSCNYFRVGPDQ